MNESQACCAHCRVVLKHTDNPDGTRSDYWECDCGCGQRFEPVGVKEEEIRVLQNKVYGLDKDGYSVDR